MDKVKNIPKEFANTCKVIVKDRYDQYYCAETNAEHKKHIILDAVLIFFLTLFIIATGYIYFIYSDNIASAKVDVVLVPRSDTVRSGDELDVLVEIENNFTEDIYDVTFEFVEQCQFCPVQADPYPLNDRTFFIGELAAGQSTIVTVNGFLYTDIGQTSSIVGILKYNSDSIFGGDEKLVSAPVFIDQSTLDISLDIDETIVANQPFEFKIVYHNTSKATKADNVLIYPTLPPEMQILETSMPLDIVSAAYKIDSIGSIESGIITGTAVLRDTTANEAEMTVEIFVAPEGELYLQDRFSKKFSVQSPNVTGSLVLDPNQKFQVSLGEDISYMVEIENKEIFALNNVRVEADIDPRLWQFNEGRSPFPLPFEQIILSEESAQKEFTLTLRESIDAKEVFGGNQSSLAIPMYLVYENNKGSDTRLLLEVQPPALLTDAKIEGSVRYNSPEGEAIGRGPLPPIAGEETVYWVFINIENTINPILESVLSAKLVEGVEFTGLSSVTLGSDPFISADRITWEVGRIENHQSRNKDLETTLALQLAVTPGVADIGSPLKLVESIILRGRDIVANAPVEVKGEDILNIIEVREEIVDNGIVTK